MKIDHYNIDLTLTIRQAATVQHALLSQLSNLRRNTTFLTDPHDPTFNSQREYYEQTLINVAALIERTIEKEIQP